MKKTTKTLGILNVVLTAFMLIVSLALLPELMGDGWALLGYLSLSVFGLIAALILTVPLVVFLVKYKLPAIKFYFYSHIALFAMSLLLLAFVFIFR